MTDDRPPWARRMTREREARNWSYAEAVRALRAHSRKALPKSQELASDVSLVRQWKRWETGEHVPSDFYQPLIAAVFGTVTHAIFPTEGRREANAELINATGMDTLELVHRLQTTDADDSTIDGLRIVTDRLCSEYPYLPSEQLLVEGRNWLQRLSTFRGQRLTLAQHREILVLAGWLALLIGCVEYDAGRRHDAETTRRAALSLGAEADHSEISAWAYEMRAWFALTTGDYHGVISAANSGLEVAPNHPVAVQLAAQEAKAWARIGDKRQTEVSLDRGRKLLDSLPYPDNLDHHFVVDPTKFDFYAMDCYRHLATTRLRRPLLMRSSRPVRILTEPSARLCV
jgi:transcriptional regulator with XRE-family HTH domain